MVKLEVQIGTLKFSAVFRVFDNDDSIFDIIINLKTQADYKLLVDADSKYLYVKRVLIMLMVCLPLVRSHWFFWKMCMNFIHSVCFAIY